MTLKQPTVCPCCSTCNFSDCCQPFLQQQTIPQTPEQLMRSRYTAYTLADIDYIMATMTGAALEGYDPISAKQWAEQAQWRKLEVLRAPEVTQTETEGFVEFKAYFNWQGKPDCIHENSRFSKKSDGRWYYTDGHIT